MPEFDDSGLQEVGRAPRRRWRKRTLKAGQQGKNESDFGRRGRRLSLLRNTRFWTMIVLPVIAALVEDLTREESSLKLTGSRIRRRITGKLRFFKGRERRSPA